MIDEFILTIIPIDIHEGIALPKISWLVEVAASLEFGYDIVQKRYVKP